MSEPNQVTAYVGLGSNLEQPRQQLTEALGELAELPGSRLGAHSSLYLSPPVGPADQPDYVNAVAAIVTSLSAESLLDALQTIENRHGRERTGERWGPRTLDLDLLLYGDNQIRIPRLQVPHPRMGERAFVLVPLAEIASGELQIPGLGRLSDLLSKLSEDAVERLD